jgi:hypothetical protein
VYKQNISQLGGGGGGFGKPRGARFFWLFLPFQERKVALQINFEGIDYCAHTKNQDSATFVLIIHRVQANIRGCCFVNQGCSREPSKIPSESPFSAEFCGKFICNVEYLFSNHTKYYKFNTNNS